MPSLRAYVKTILAFGMITFVIQIIVGLITLIYGILIVFPEISHHTYVLYVIAPVLIAVGEISGNALAAYYLLIVAAIVMSAVWLFRTSTKTFMKELTMKAESRNHSAIFDLCGLMFGVLFLNFIIILASGILWEEPTVPTEGADLWELLFLLANASVWEELVVRVLLIGVPLLLIDLLRDSLKGSGLKYLFGGGFKLGAAEVVLIIVSSGLFGFAHFEGWGAWKVFPASVAGVAFGYMFLRHGLASAIILHFGFDYLSLPVEVFAEGSDAGIIVQAMATLFWIILGAVFFTYYIVRMVEFVTRRKFFEDKPIPHSVLYAPHYGYGYQPASQQWHRPPPSFQTEPGQGQTQSTRVSSGPPPQGLGPGGFFLCPVCGHTEARWQDGKFQCLRCGTVV